MIDYSKPLMFDPTGEGEWRPCLVLGFVEQNVVVYDPKITDPVEPWVFQVQDPQLKNAP